MQKSLLALERLALDSGLLSEQIGTCVSRTLAEADMRICTRPAEIARLPGDSMKAEQKAVELVAEAAANFEELVI
jgi:hypothetical protein